MHSRRSQSQEFSRKVRSFEHQIVHSCFQLFLHINCSQNTSHDKLLIYHKFKKKNYLSISNTEDRDTYPHTRLAKPTMIPEANIAYPALRDSGAYICAVGTLSNFVCRIIATITPYIATASQKITLRKVCY